MSVELNSVVQEVIIDDSKAVSGSARVVGAMENMAVAADKATAANVRQASGFSALDAALKTSAPAQESALRRLNAWKAQADPVEASLQRLSRAETDLNRAISQGAASEQDKIRILDQLWNKLLGAAEAQEKLNAATRAQAAQGAFNSQLGVRDDFGAKDRAADIEAYGRELDQLQAKFDPVYRAQQLVTQETEALTRAHQTGAISQETYAVGMARIRANAGTVEQAIEAYTAEVQQAKAALDAGSISQMQFANALMAADSRLAASSAQFVSQSTRGQNSARQMGVAIQQAGYQIGDFAVQVASGQGVLRPFIQQGTQFVSMFGPWGAVLGAAGAVVGAVATTFFQLGNNADEAGKKGTESLKDIEDQARRTKQELEGIASYYDRIALARARMDQVSAGTGVVAARARLDALEPGQDTRAAQRALIEAQDAEQRAYMAERGILAKLAGEKDNVVAATNAEIKKTQELTRAMEISRHEYDVTNETMKILANSGYRGTEKEARALAEQVVASKEAFDKASKAVDGHTKATKAQSKSYEDLSRRADSYFARLAQENQFLELKVNGQEELIPLLKAEADLREILGRELLPGEEEGVRRLVKRHEELNRTLKSQEEAQRAAAQAAEEQERIWTRAAENIQDALADAIFSGKNLFESLKDVALSVAKQIAAAMIFRPIIAPILGGVSGIGALGALGGGAGGAGGMMSLGSNLSSIWSALNGPSTLGTNFAMSGVGQWLGLSNAPVSGVGPIGLTGLGSSVASIGNLLGAGGIGYGIGSIWSSLGLGTSVGSSIGGALGGAIGSIIPGVGTIIGSIAGSALGGLFGNNQPSDKFAQTTVDLAGGKLGQTTFASGDKYSQQNVDATKALAEQFLALEQQIVALTGGTAPDAAFAKVGSRDGIVVGVGKSGIGINSQHLGMSATFANSEAGAQQALDFMVQALARQISGVANADIQTVLNRGGTAQEVLDNLTLVKGILNATAEAADPLTTALKAVNDNFDDLDKKARDLGLSTDLLTKLEAVRQKQLDEITAGASLGTYQNVQGALSQLNDWMTQQRLSDVSSLNPLGRQSLAQSTFDDLFKAVNDNGDLTKVGALTSSASNLLSIARQNYGSTAGFTSVESQVHQALSNLGLSISSQESIGDQVSRAIALSTQTNTEKLDELKAEIVKMRQAFSLMSQKLAA